MGMCKTCNKDAGWLSHECSDCRSQREAAEKAKLEADREAAELERQAKIDEMVESAMADLRARVDAGGTVWLYDSFVLDLDRGFLDAVALNRLREIGERGWTIATSQRHARVENGINNAVTDFWFDQVQIVVGLGVSAANMHHLDGEIRDYYTVRAAEEFPQIPVVVEYPELVGR